MGASLLAVAKSIYYRYKYRKNLKICLKSPGVYILELH